MSKILESELVFYASANTGNLGGAITGTIIPKATLHNTFPKIDADKALTGYTSYMCVYLKNTNSITPLEEAAVFLTANTQNSSTNISYGIGSSGVSGTEQSIASDSISPLGVTFISNLSMPTQVGDVPPGEHFAIWLKLEVDPASPATAVDGFTLSVQGKTTA